MIYHINYPDDEGVKYESFRYPGGEYQVRLLETDTNPAASRCAKATELWLTARIRDGELMKLGLLIDAMRGTRDVPVSLVLPYLPYSRADREFTAGDCCGLGVMGTILNSFGLKEVVTVDVHNEKQSKYFIDDFRNLSPLPLIQQAITELAKPITILLPDAGAARYGIEKLGHKVLTCGKCRNQKTGVLTGFEVPPPSHFVDKNVLIVDDICDGGGSFIGIAEMLKDYGLNLNLWVTHGIFSKGLKELFNHFTTIYTTNTFQPRYKDAALQMIPYEGLNVFGGLDHGH